MAEAKFRRVHFTDGLTGLARRFYALATKPVTDSADEHSDAAEDVYLGGGGGCQMCHITALNAANYITVKLWNGTTEGAELNVAKSMPARMPASETIDTISFTYSYTDDNTRLANYSGVSVQQQMFQRFVVGGVVFVIAADHTGVVVGGSELKYLEINTAREWTEPSWLAV